MALVLILKSVGAMFMHSHISDVALRGITVKMGLLVTISHSLATTAIDFVYRFCNNTLQN